MRDAAGEPTAAGQHPLFAGCRLSSPLHHGIHARYPSGGGVGESGSKPSSAGVSGMRSTRKYFSLSSQCSRTMVRGLGQIRS